MRIDRQQQCIHHQRQRQVDNGQKTPGRVTNIPLHARIKLVAMPLSRHRATDDATTATQDHHTKPQQQSSRYCCHHLLTIKLNKKRVIIQ